MTRCQTVAQSARKTARYHLQLPHLHAQRAQRIPIAGIGLADAGRIENDDAADPEGGEREAHRDAVVLIGLDARRQRLSSEAGIGCDDQIVAVLAAEAGAVVAVSEDDAVPTTGATPGVAPEFLSALAGATGRLSS